MPEFAISEESRPTPPTDPPKKNWWLVIGTALMELAAAILIQKYGVSIPNWLISLIFIIGAIPAFIAAIRYDGFVRAGGKIKDQIKDYPLSFGFLCLLFFLIFYGIASTFSSRRENQITVASVSDNSNVPKIIVPPAVVLPPPTKAPKKLAIKILGSQLYRAPALTSGVYIGGGVDMSGDGCQQKIISGSNNTNNCSPALPRISDSQASTMIGYLKKDPNLSAHVLIGYETAVEGGQELAQKLQEILKAANIDTTIEGAMMIAGCSNGAHPGLSIACEDPMNTELADAIDKALIKSKITKNPLKREQNPLQDNLSLELIIKHP